MYLFIFPNETRIKLKKKVVPFLAISGIIQGEPTAPCTCRNYDVRWNRSHNTSSDGSDPLGITAVVTHATWRVLRIALSNFSPMQHPSCRVAQGLWQILYLQKNQDSFLPNSSSLMLEWNSIFCTHTICSLVSVYLCVSVRTCNFVYASFLHSVM